MLLIKKSMSLKPHGVTFSSFFSLRQGVCLYLWGYLMAVESQFRELEMGSMLRHNLYLICKHSCSFTKWPLIWSQSYLMTGKYLDHSDYCQCFGNLFQPSTFRNVHLFILLYIHNLGNNPLVLEKAAVWGAPGWGSWAKHLTLGFSSGLGDRALQLGPFSVWNFLKILFSSPSVPPACSLLPSLSKIDK